MTGDLIRYNFVKRKRITAANDLEVVPITAADVLNHEKFLYFEELLGRGKTSVHFLTGGRGVEIPDFLRQDPVCVLNWSMRFGLPDFEFDDVSVRGTLSFNREPFYVVIPWEAVGKIHLAEHPSEKREWASQAPQVQQFIFATPAQMAALLGNLPPNFAIAKPQLEEVERGTNEPTPAPKSPSAVEAGIVRRVLGKIRGGLGAIFGE